MHVCEGHYARRLLPAGFQADSTVDTVGDLCGLSAKDILSRAHDDGDGDAVVTSRGADTEQ